jgi:hypothetical protein
MNPTDYYIALSSGRHNISALVFRSGVECCKSFPNGVFGQFGNTVQF